jgi:hypothetical protein
MPPWSSDDLESLQQLGYPDLSAASVQALYELYGGNVRNVFEDRMRDVEQRKMDLVAKIRSIDIMSAMETVGTAETTAGRYAGLLFSIVPEPIPDPKKNYKQNHSFSWASTFILDTATSLIFELSLKKLKLYIDIGSGVPMIQDVRGKLFEHSTHRLMVVLDYC